MAQTRKVSTIPWAPDHARLGAAAAAGDLALVRSLLDAGVSPAAAEPAGGTTALHEAARHGHVAVIEELLARGAPLEAPLKNARTTPLGAAVGGGHLAAVRALLARGARHDVRYGRGRATALWSAASSGRADLVGALIEAGADVRAPNEYGITPIAAAVGGATSERAPGDARAVIERLVAAGVDPHEPLPPNGESAVKQARALGRDDLFAVETTTSAGG